MRHGRHVPPGAIILGLGGLKRKLLAGESVDPSLVYFRTVPKFETSAKNLQHLTRSIFIGIGERYPTEVVVRFWKVE